MLYGLSFDRRSPMQNYRNQNVTSCGIVNVLTSVYMLTGFCCDAALWDAPMMANF